MATGSMLLREYLDIVEGARRTPVLLESDLVDQIQANAKDGTRAEFEADVKKIETDLAKKGLLNGAWTTIFDRLQSVAKKVATDPQTWASVAASLFGVIWMGHHVQAQRSPNAARFARELQNAMKAKDDKAVAEILAKIKRDKEIHSDPNR